MAKEFTFSVKGLAELEKDLKKAAKYYEKKVNDLLTLMTKAGEQFAVYGLQHIDTGETLESIVGYRKGNKGYVVAGGNAIWIEFGTGVTRNSGNAHPPVLDSTIPIYPHGGYGKGKGKNPNGWWYYDEDKNSIKHTRGIRGNQFMYRAYEGLVNNFPELADEVFNK